MEFQKDGSYGFYLYDLNSTHGTYLNKAKVPVHKYYRVKVGHMMKFGGSSRIYILQVNTYQLLVIYSIIRSFFGGGYTTMKHHPQTISEKV